MRGPITGVVNASQPGMTVHLNPSFKPSGDMGAERFCEAFDRAMAALAEVGFHPTEISHLGDGTQRIEMTRYEIEQAARASERRLIADQLMAWAERNQEQERYGPASALSIASNMVRKGGTP